MPKAGKIIAFLVGVLSFLTTSFSWAQPCNGKERYCQKRYDEMTFATTHNAQSFRANWLFAPLSSNINNQTADLSTQLADGIRAMKMPLLLSQGEISACHGLKPHIRQKIDRDYCEKAGFLKGICRSILFSLDPCQPDPAATRLADVLQLLDRFLNDNPREVFTLFLEDFVEDFELLNQVFEVSGVSHWTYHHGAHGEVWPTLGEMIQEEKRLLVFLNSDQDSAGRKISEYPNFNSTSKYSWSSRYHFKNAEDLEKDVPLRSPFLIESKLWILQHFVTPLMGGSPRHAAIVNEAAFLKQRVQKFTERLGRKPNFIWLDFYDHPSGPSQVLEAIEELNL